MTSTTAMRAAVLRRRGAADHVVVEEVPAPGLGARDLLVRVLAAAVTPVDVAHRRGTALLRRALPLVLGSELAGEVVEVGEAVRGWEVGDRVAVSSDELGRDRDGAHAELCAVPAAQAHLLPPGIDPATTVAGLPLAGAWSALLDVGRLGDAERVLVTGPTSALGLGALQLAYAHGAQVIAVADRGTPATAAARLRELGAATVLDADGLDVPGAVVQATDGRGASLVLELTGGRSLGLGVAALGSGGRMVVPAARHQALPVGEAPLAVAALVAKGATVIGCPVSPPPAVVAEVLSQVAAGRLGAVVDRVLPLSAVAEAHLAVERGEALGAVVLDPTR